MFLSGTILRQNAQPTPALTLPARRQAAEKMGLQSALDGPCRRQDARLLGRPVSRPPRLIGRPPQLSLRPGGSLLVTRRGAARCRSARRGEGATGSRGQRVRLAVIPALSHGLSLLAARRAGRRGFRQAAHRRRCDSAVTAGRAAARIGRICSRKCRPPRAVAHVDMSLAGVVPGRPASYSRLPWR